MPDKNNARFVRSAAVLEVSDVVASRDYYRNKLGFESDSMWGDPPCFCIVGRDTVTLFLDQSRKARVPLGNQYWSAYIYVDDIASIADGFRSRGVGIERGPEDTQYGCREVDVRDPDGHVICFAQDLTPSDAGPGL